MDNLFATHPATENRIAALEQLAREMGGGGGSSLPRRARRSGLRQAPPSRPVGPATAAPGGPWG